MRQHHKAGGTGQVFVAELTQIFERKGEGAGDNDIAHVRSQDVQFRLGQVPCLVGDQHLSDRVPALRIGPLVAELAEQRAHCRVVIAKVVTMESVGVDDLAAFPLRRESRGGKELDGADASLPGEPGRTGS